jgi:hypothetical protein
MSDLTRFHLTLAVGGRPVMQGWWSSEAAARSKLKEWAKGRGSEGVRILLVDEAEGALLAVWPEGEDQASSG